MATPHVAGKIIILDSGGVGWEMGNEGYNHPEASILGGQGVGEGQSPPFTVLLIEEARLVKFRMCISYLHMVQYYLK